jgi:hypothetical protein
LQKIRVGPVCGVWCVGDMFVRVCQSRVNLLTMRREERNHRYAFYTDAPTHSESDQNAAMAD